MVLARFKLGNKLYKHVHIYMCAFYSVRLAVQTPHFTLAELNSMTELTSCEAWCLNQFETLNLDLLSRSLDLESARNNGCGPVLIQTGQTSHEISLTKSLDLPLSCTFKNARWTLSSTIAGIQLNH